jgi:hypothetical protein
MPLTEHQSITGVLTITLRDADGRVALERRVRNLITRDGKLLLAGLFTGKVDAGVSLAIAVGSGEAAPLETDAALGQQEDAADALIVALDPFEHEGGWRVKAVVTATLKARPGDAAVKQLREAGILVRTKVPGQPPVLFNHVAFPVISKGNNVEMTLTWEITL